MLEWESIDAWEIVCLEEFVRLTPSVRQFMAEVGGILGVYVLPFGDAEVRAAEEALRRGGFDNPVWAEDVDVGVDVYVFGNEVEAQ